jgi:hypothetical protein
MHSQPGQNSTLFARDQHTKRDADFSHFSLENRYSFKVRLVPTGGGQ